MAAFLLVALAPPLGLVGGAGPALLSPLRAQRPSLFPEAPPRSAPLASGAAVERTRAAPPPSGAVLRSEALGEAIGTFMLLALAFGLGGSALMTPVSLAHMAAVSGFSVVLGTGVATRLFSEAHMNPAVTLAMVLYRGFSPRRALVYVCAQLVGATFAALFAACAFLPQVQAHGGWLPFQLAFSAAEKGAAGGFAARALAAGAHEAWATCVLVFLVLHLEDNPSKPVTIGGVVALLVSVAGPLSGAGLNPARDVGPRLAAALLRATCAPQLAGGGAAQAAAYIIGPLAGGALGGLLSALADSVRAHAADAPAGPKGAVARDASPQS